MLNYFVDINNKWKKIVSNNKVLKFFPSNIVVLLISLIILVFATINVFTSNYNVLYERDNGDVVMSPLLVDSKQISFDNINIYKEPSNVCFKFATYNRKNNAKYRYNLYNNDQLIYTYDFSAKRLKDNDYHCFKFSNIDYSKLDEYKAEIKPIYADGNNAVTMYVNESEDVNIRIIKYNGIISFKTIIFFVLLFFFLIVNYFINIRKLSPSSLWLFFSFYIVCTCLLIPPFEVPDESIHFFSTYNYTQYNSNPNDNILSTPDNLMCLTYSKPQEKDKVLYLGDVQKCFANSKNENIWYKDVREIKPYGYLFSIVGIHLGDLFSNSPMIIFYLGRLFNTIASCIIIYLAIKNAPKYKNVILFTATIPMFIQQMASYSYDSILNSFILLLSSLLLLLAYGRNIRIKSIIISIILSLIFIFGIKMIYIPIILILLFDDTNLTNKQKTLTLFISVIISFLIYKIVDSLLIPLTPRVESTNQNFIYFMNNPLSIIPIAINTIKLKTWFYVESMIGYFSWFIYKYPIYMIVTYLAIMVYLIISNENKASIKSRIIPFIGLLLSISAVFGAMYFSWSDYGLDYIDGVQGRYFLPLIPFFMILLMPKKKKVLADDLTLYNLLNVLLLYFVLFTMCSYY